MVETLERAVRENVPTGLANDPDANRAAVDGVIRRVAKNVWYEAVPGGHAHCTCRPGTADLAEARCLIEKAGRPRPWDPGDADDPPASHADLAWAGLSRCLCDPPDDPGRGGCRFAATDAEDRATLARTRREAKAAMGGAPTPATKDAAECLLQGIEIAEANGRPSTGPS